MIKIAICDDDSFMVKDIKNRTEAYFKETCVECKITTFDDGEPLVQTYNSCDKPFDIIILDMKLKRMNGDDASKMIRSLDQDVILIFISSWISYAVFGYEVNAHRFIPKDGEKSNDDLTGALESAYQLMQSRKQYMLIHQNNGIVRIGLREILYIEALNKNLMVHCIDDVYRFSAKLGLIEKELENSNIMRCHRSYLVNVEHITAVKKDFLQLTGGKEIPVSRPYRKLMLDRLTDYLGADL